jgi:glycosyltransferase involved in cell wall biosynthesis
MTVSIVIPAWNCSHTLRETIESALDQRGDCEIVVVDDGSTDDTLAVARSFAEHVTCFTGENAGVAAARNRGFAAAKGQWIQFLDSDDLLTKDTIACRLDTLLSENADIAVTSWTEFRGDSQKVSDASAREANWQRFDQDGAAIACATSFWAPPAAILYRREVVDRVGGFLRSVSPIEDARFLFDAANFGFKIARVNQNGAKYRVLPDSFSRRDPAAFALAVLRNAGEIESTWHRGQILDAHHKAALVEIYNGAACALFRCKHPEFQTAMSRLRALGGKPGRYARYADVATRVVGMRAARSAFALIGH